MGIGMSWQEHTPHTHDMRDTATPPPSQKPESPSGVTTQVESAPDMATEHTVVVESVHYYTLPNRDASGHYPDSALCRDIIKNPALYMDRADF